MTNKKKAAPAGTGTASNTSIDGSNHTRQHLKAAIVRLALWGLLPAKLAAWLIERGGLKDA